MLKEGIKIYGVQVYSEGGANPAWHYPHTEELSPVHDPGAITTALLTAIIANFEGGDLNDNYSGFGSINYLAFDHNTKDESLKEIIMEFDRNIHGSTIALIRDKIGSENQKITGNITRNFLEMYEVIKKKYRSIQNINETIEWKILITHAAAGLSNISRDLKEDEKLYSGKHPILKFTFAHDLSEFNRNEVINKLGNKLLSIISIDSNELKNSLGAKFLPNKNKIDLVNRRLKILINEPENIRKIHDFKSDYENLYRVFNEYDLFGGANQSFKVFYKGLDGLKDELLSAVDQIEFRYFKGEDIFSTYLKEKWKEANGVWQSNENKFKNLCLTLIWSSRDLFKLKGESVSRQVFASFIHKKEEYWLSVYHHIEERGEDNLEIGNVGGIVLKPIIGSSRDGNPGWILTEALKNTTLFCNKYSFSQSDVIAKLSTTEKSLKAETKSYIDSKTASKAYLTRKYTRTK